MQRTLICRTRRYALSMARRIRAVHRTPAVAAAVSAWCVSETAVIRTAANGTPATSPTARPTAGGAVAVRRLLAASSWSVTHPVHHPAASCHRLHASCRM